MNLTKTFFLLFLTMLLGISTLAAATESPLSVAVYDFVDTDPNAGNYGAKVTILVTANLTTETNLDMVERSDLRKALGEQALDISGFVNSDQAAKIGQLTGAKVLVSGQVIKTGKNRLIIVADIVGVETGRLFAEKVAGATEKLNDLASDLSRKVARIIRERASSLVKEAPVSREAYLENIVSSIKGTNRPSVSVNFRSPWGTKGPVLMADTEMAMILQKAGFKVVDSLSDSKPDIEISGFADCDVGPKRGDLYSARAVVEAKARERESGKIIVVDRQVVDAVDAGRMTAKQNSQAKAVDAVAEKILPLLGNELQK